jgi:hypothetical protein
MIDREATFPAAAVLTCIIVPPKDLAAGELDAGTRAPHLKFESDHRRSRKYQGDGAKVSPTIGHHGCLSPEDENHSPPRRANVDGLKVGVQDQDGFVHGTSAILRIIA